jgi:hypothetical protein
MRSDAIASRAVEDRGTERRLLRGICYACGMPAKDATAVDGGRIPIEAHSQQTLGSAPSSASLPDVSVVFKYSRSGENKLNASSSIAALLATLSYRSGGKKNGCCPGYRDRL